MLYKFTHINTVTLQSYCSSKTEGSDINRILLRNNKQAFAFIRVHLRLDT